MTSSFDKATIISPNSPGTGVASSSTDLSTATTHASGQSTNGGQAVSDAKLGDTIHFAVAGANASTVTTIGFQYVVHGIYLDFDPANADTELSAHLNIASASPNTQNLAFGANLDVQANSGNNGVPTVLTATAGFLFGGFGTAVITSQTPGGFRRQRDVVSPRRRLFDLHLRRPECPPAVRCRKPGLHLQLQFHVAALERQLHLGLGASSWRRRPCPSRVRWAWSSLAVV